MHNQLNLRTFEVQSQIHLLHRSMRVQRSGESAKRSNVVSELEAATAAFKTEKNPTALAARLRIILAKLRGGK